MAALLRKAPRLFAYAGDYSVVLVVVQSCQRRRGLAAFNGKPPLSATGGSPPGNPTGPEAARFTRRITTIFILTLRGHVFLRN